MTDLVRTTIITITEHRDEHPDFPFDDILPKLRKLPRYMRKRYGYVTIEMRQIGSEEVYGAGDN